MDPRFAPGTAVSRKPEVQQTTKVKMRAERRGIVWLISLMLIVLPAGGCGGSGNSGGGQPPPPPQNPTPAITSLTPAAANAGDSAFTLTVAGYNFVTTSKVEWNGSALTTTYSSDTQLQAQVSAANIATSGIATVSVVNPSPGGGGSGNAEFAINSTSNPAPSALSLNPNSVNSGSSDFILTLNGSNFVPSSTIQWNGTAIPTTYLSDTQLEAQIAGSYVANSGLIDVTVQNPAPGGGTSSPLELDVILQPTIANQLANDMVWDASHQLIYLSVPSVAPTNGNTVVALDPATDTIGSPQFAGSEPDVLAISDDSQFLYAGIDGASSVQRFTLPNLVPDVKYALGAGPYPQGPYFAVDLGVAPGLAHTTAVSRGAFNVSPVALGGMAIYDDSTRRPNVASGSLYDSLAWGSDKTLYATDNEISGFELYVLTVNSNGVTQSQDYPGEFSGYYARMHFCSGTGFVYTDDGYVINPANGKHVGAFQAAGYMVPDSGLNRAFFFGQTQSQSGTTSFTIESFNLTTFAPIAEIVVSGVQGYPLRFIRWGANGVAFNDDAGYIYLLANPFAGADGLELRSPQENLKPVTNLWLEQKKPSAQQKLMSGTWSRPLKPRHVQAQDSNPAPTLSTIDPSMVAAGEVGLNGMTLTVTGDNFVSLSTVEWNGSRRPTQFVSTTELQAQISFTDVQNAGSIPVTVTTPAPGGGTSSALAFSVVNQNVIPAPVIVSLIPNSVSAGSSDFTLQVHVDWPGINSSSVVMWNGSPRPTSYTGDLFAQISAADVASAGYAEVTVYTAPPGGGISNPLEFQILYQPVSINQSVNDIIWDPTNQVFYISVPSSASTNADQVCVLNPTTQAITSCQPGNEPDALAISDDSQFLYVGMDDVGSVQRYVLPGLTPDISYSLGTYETGTPYYALDLQVAPGNPHTTAVSKGVMYLDPGAQGGVTIYDDATARPVSAPGDFQLYDSIQWSSDGRALYSANSESTSFDFYTLAVNSSGVTLDRDYPSVFWNPGRIHFDSTSGLVYSDDGFHAIDPSTGLPAGIFEVGGGWPMAPDSSLNAVFIVDQYIWQPYSNYTLNMFDMTHYVRTGWVPFTTSAQLGFNPPRRFIPWGSGGLALTFKGDKIYLLPTSLVEGAERFARHDSLSTGQAPGKSTNSR